ncbi:hypothetical protein VST7929_00312 [Vibrio stylophorae]|uniref:AAA+ ATPase domain-containing protein n=1 Tax=Vibrio stylophorae TaxID=659351 RepID=A0ABM8ZQB2_9VIBR|nr:AAA family ATPase [Vibrio stylophorae]CAH0532482.1 hypothetical protein VST7929_00312 [Vibrio stylophorae]
MYQDYYQLKELPFTIVPNARFVFLSARHREALHQLTSGLANGGGLGLLTGEVGTGKTTVARLLMTKLDKEAQIGMLLNPTLTVEELLTDICKAFDIECPSPVTIKERTDLIYDHLMANHEAGKQSLLLVDEAQHLLPQVLEQLRLLTNLETDQHKLLKVVLIGQPELQHLLQHESLRQLAQRITARYHLMPLTTNEVGQYIRHRLDVAGAMRPLFDQRAIDVFAKATSGVPRLINLCCDKALQLAQQRSLMTVDRPTAVRACQEVLEWQTASVDQKALRATQRRNRIAKLTLSLAALGVAAWAFAPRLQQLMDARLPAASPASAVASTPATSIPASAPHSTLSSTPGEDAFARLQQVDSTGVNGHSVEMAVASESERAQLAKAIEQSRNQERAFIHLYETWGYQVFPREAKCSSADRAGLHCYKGESNLDLLSRLNRPVILTLQDDRYIPYYAVLYRQWPDSYELLVGDIAIRVTKSWLQQYWRGDMVTLWRPPEGGARSIRYGQRGERVQWLDGALQEWLGIKDLSIERFDQTLLARVRQFQEANGLAPDGVAGPETLMMLDAALKLPGPTLRPVASRDKAPKPAWTEPKLVTFSVMPMPTFFAEPLAPKAENEYSNLTPEIVAEPAAKKKPTKPTASPEKVKTASVNQQSEDLNLDEIDYSSMSPELAAQLREAVAATADDEPMGSVTQPLEKLPNALRRQLPPLNFQTHLYASNPERRWVKVNDVEVRQGEMIAPNLKLVAIEPRSVVLQYNDVRFSMPALSEWAGE